MRCYMAGRNTKTIAMIIAPENYREQEFEIPYNFFTRNGARVDVFSTRKGMARGASGGSFDVKNSLNELKVENYDAIVFIGGPGTPILRRDENAAEIAMKAYSSGKVVAGICWSVTILAKAGILEGKKATVWFGTDPEYGMTTAQFIEKQGGRYEKKGLVVDGRIITADGPANAEGYAKAVWNAIDNQ